MQIDRRILMGVCATVAFSTLGGFVAMRYVTSGNLNLDAVHGQASHKAAAGAHDNFTCPMHPEIVQDHPGNCPICGMTLVKLKDGTTTQHKNLMHVDPQTQERMGVRLVAAEETRMHLPLRAVATIGTDESDTVSVNPKVEGWIKRLHVHGVGQPVRKGQVLYELYSPELQQRQREYVDLLTRRESLLESTASMGGSSSAMVGSLAKERFRARDRLLAADMTPEAVLALEKNRRILDIVPVHATHDGVVTAVSAREGAFVNPMQPVLSYAGTGKAWAEITVFPDQLAWIRNGDEVVFTSTINKTARTTARINLSTMQVDPATRTAKLRLSLANAKGAFQPGTLADVQIKTSVRHTLAVPRDAIIRTGHGDYVVVSEGDGHFRSAQVKTGIESDQHVEILAGLAKGNEVAVNAQFLLDAGASMQAMHNRFASHLPSQQPMVPVAHEASAAAAVAIQHPASKPVHSEHHGSRKADSHGGKHTEVRKSNRHGSGENTGHESHDHGHHAGHEL